MGGEYDISAFIIPPPPTSDEKDNRSSDIIRRLYEAKEGISKVCLCMKLSDDLFGFFVCFLDYFCQL